MHGTREIIEEAIALPVEERAVVVDSLLRSLNAPDAAIDSEWIAVARRRQAELRAGVVQRVPGDEVLARARQRSVR